MDESDETRLMGDEGESDPDATVYARPGENPDATVYAPPSVSHTAGAPRRAPEPVRNAVPSPRRRATTAMATVAPPAAMAGVSTVAPTLSASRLCWWGPLSLSSSLRWCQAA